MSLVLLGFQDLQISVKDKTDWSINKFGGKPDLMFPLQEYPRCLLCNSLLYHLTQIYCPLQSSSYHRTLYVFGCAQKQCWNKTGSVVVLRSQLLDKTYEEKSYEKQTTSKIENDDWGTNTWISTDSCGSDDWGTNASELVDNCVNDWINCMEEVSSDTLKADKKQCDNIDVISCTFNAKLHIEDVPYFVGYYVSVTTEADMEREACDYEMKLCQEYISREGEIMASNFRRSCKGDGEKYEKTDIKHGDHAFYRFKKKISNSPTQCLRYGRNGSPLLLSSVSKCNPSLDSIPNCQYCGSNRIFEIQLMPNLTTCLHTKKQGINTGKSLASTDSLDNKSTVITNRNEVLCFDDDDETLIEFGCIYVYTCSNSCWQNNNLRNEFAVLQPDPDEAVHGNIIL